MNLGAQAGCVPRETLAARSTQVLRRHPDHVGTEPATGIDQTKRKGVDPRRSMPTQRAVAEEADRAPGKRLFRNTMEVDKTALLGRGICVSPVHGVACPTSQL